jgi:5-methylcytosine-specific restriction endonuclease McrA
MIEVEILEYLRSMEMKAGRSQVEHAVRRYMKDKRFAGERPEKRKKIPKSWTLLAWEKQDGICPRCNERVSPREMSGDHKVPLARGGKHIISNIQAMHKSCNSSKGMNDPITESKRTGKTIMETLSHGRD